MFAARAQLALIVLCVAIPAAGADGPAQTIPTFARDVAPILFENCASCHRPGGAGPFSLLDYDSARKRARQIARVTGDGYMPPWLPVRGAVRYVGERGLDATEIETLAAWADSGAAAGDLAEAPEAPKWKDGWQLGTPDLVVRLGESYALEAGGADVFRNFVIPLELDGPRWVRAYEFQPTPARIVHHAVVNVDRSRSARRLDALDPGPGYAGMTASGVRNFDGHIVAWTPGKTPGSGPADLAWKIEPGSDLVLHLHLLPSGKPEQVDAALALHFAERPPTREPFLLRLGSKTIDIAAGERAYTIDDAYRLPVDVEALGIYPHAHFLARSMEAWAELPDGTLRTLLRIDDWDFNWQDDYTFVEPIALPAGTTVAMRYTYDNSADNPRQSVAPPQRVQFGPRSTDEMGDLWLQVATRRSEELVTLRHNYARKEAAAELDAYLALSRRFPGVAEYLAGAGLMQFRLGRLDDAQASLVRARALDPRDGAAANHLGLVLQARGETAAALEAFREAVRYEPAEPGYRSNLGVALRAAGDLTGAIAQYRAVLALQPDHARAHANLGVALQASGAIDEAVEHYRRAIALEPDSARSRFNLGVALATQGETLDAIEQLRSATALESQLGVAWSALASASADLERWDEAVAAATRALELAERSQAAAVPELRRKLEEYRRHGERPAGQAP